MELGELTCDQIHTVALFVHRSYAGESLRRIIVNGPPAPRWCVIYPIQWTWALVCNLLCSMYNCNKCTTATVNVRVWHMTVPPAFFASRADTNPCNHRMNCSPLRNLHRRHVEIYLPPRCTDSQKSCGLLDKKGSNFWIIQPWRNQNLAFLSLSPQHPDWIPSHPFSRLLTPPGHHPFSRSRCPIITIVCPPSFPIITSQS